jgi:hypothetical protein
MVIRVEANNVSFSNRKVVHTFEKKCSHIFYRIFRLNFIKNYPAQSVFFSECMKSFTDLLFTLACMKVSTKFTEKVVRPWGNLILMLIYFIASSTSIMNIRSDFLVFILRIGILMVASIYFRVKIVWR